MLEDHEEIHSKVRWRRVCDLFEDHPLWKLMNHEDRKVYEHFKYILEMSIYMSLLHVQCTCDAFGV